MVVRPGDINTAMNFLKDNYSLSAADEGYFIGAAEIGLDKTIKELKEDKEFNLYCRLAEIDAGWWIEDFRKRTEENLNDRD